MKTSRSFIGYLTSNGKVTLYSELGRTGRNAILILPGSDTEDYEKHRDILPRDRIESGTSQMRTRIASQ